MKRNPTIATLLLIMLAAMVAAPAALQAQKRNKPKKQRPRPAPRPQPTSGKTLVYEDLVYEDHIRTVQFYRGADVFSYPIIYLGDPTQLMLEFDALISEDGNPENFWIDVVNCNHAWEPTNLLALEFMDGLTTDRMYDFERSQNTMIPYVHYKYRFPADNVTFKRSGNYLLRVYRAGDEKDLILTRRFIVAGRKVGVEPLLGQSLAASERRKIQRVDFNIHLTGALKNMFDPRNDLKVVLLQNFRWDNAVTGVQPLFVTDRKLEYQFDAGTEFEGGNEYRMMDIRSMRFHTEKMKKVDNRDSVYHVTLYPEKPRLRNIYYSQQDLNGNYVIQVQEYPNDEYESDYVLVRFALKYPEPITDGSVHVFGKFSDWRCMPETRMAYNPATYQFETEVLMKQGVYDYQFVVNKKDGTGLDETRLEGSHYETENYYTILVYFSPPGARSDELIGISHVNYYDR